VYADRANAFTEEAEGIGMVFATHAALAWRNARREREFNCALASRDTIGQAKGIIMERYGFDAVQALEMLKHLSQESSIALAEIARRVVAAGFSDPEE